MQSALRLKRIPAVANATLGMLLWLVAELMFFSALISAYLVTRANALLAWPPPNQPRLPVAGTAFNSVLLLLSAWTLWQAIGAMKQARGKERVQRWLAATGLLGLAFVALQGFEWLRLISFGLTSSASVYGAFFYLIVGAHALHAIAGLGLIAFTWLQLQHKPELAQLPAIFVSSRTSLKAISLYWFFVVGLWPILYGLVYLL